jgi:hypothetical protein
MMRRRIERIVHLPTAAGMGDPRAHENSDGLNDDEGAGRFFAQADHEVKCNQAAGARVKVGEIGIFLDYWRYWDRIIYISD